MDEEPQDPFREEVGGAWHQSFRQGEMLLRALAELPDVTSAIVAVKKMPRSDLESIVLERLYMWHARTPADPGMLALDAWLYPGKQRDS
jgi:hypothetical protein